nr:MAG TPA: hypothetical protein [Caudoviricetes sp.]
MTNGDFYSKYAREKENNMAKKLNFEEFQRFVEENISSLWCLLRRHGARVSIL